MITSPPYFDVTNFDLLRDLSLGGQVYFVHNRVNDIQHVADRLQRIVPDARIRIGHGQMPEGELEDVMVAFVAHQFDVLLATTIVESGLDITPNAAKRLRAIEEFSDMGAASPSWSR